MENSPGNAHVNSDPTVGKDTTPGNTDAQILQALELVHNPRSSNDLRQDASRYLEEIKSQNEAPYHGYFLASNKSHSAIVQHYGLSLLEYAIRLRWQDCTEEQSMALREWILKLAQSTTTDDPLYLRNKLAQLWVEIAKRTWAIEWMNMDELLVHLWNGSVAQKELVLVVLETLSDNVFGREDTVAGLRGHDLNKACVEIFTPASILSEHFPARETSVNVRYGEEGWLARIADLLGWYNSEGQNKDVLQSCAVRALSTLKSVIGWAILKALASSNCVKQICGCMTASNQAIRLVSTSSGFPWPSCFC